MSWSELDILNDAHVTRIKWLHFWSLHLLLSYFKVIAVALKVLEKSASGHPSVSLWLWTLVFIQRDVSSSHSFIFETWDINVADTKLCQVENRRQIQSGKSNHWWYFQRFIKKHTDKRNLLWKFAEMFTEILYWDTCWDT